MNCGPSDSELVERGPSPLSGDGAANLSSLAQPSSSHATTSSPTSHIHKRVRLSPTAPIKSGGRGGSGDEMPSAPTSVPLRPQAAAAAATGSQPRSGSFFDILTAEERGMMVAEGVTIPPEGPLNKTDERELKRLRRQIKNKCVVASAMFAHCPATAAEPLPLPPTRTTFLKQPSHRGHLI